VCSTLKEILLPRKYCYIGGGLLHIIKECFRPRKELCLKLLRHVTTGSSTQSSCATEAERAAESEIDIRQQRIRVEPIEYSARRHTRLQHLGHPPSFERPQRGIAWPPSSGAYQSPAAAIPYGFQPIYVQRPAFYPGYGYTTTPPSSGQRRRAQTGDEYIYGDGPCDSASRHLFPRFKNSWAAESCFIGTLLHSASETELLECSSTRGSDPWCYSGLIPWVLGDVGFFSSAY